MRETLGVPPVVATEKRSRSRVPLWAWLFAATGLTLMMTAGIAVERSVHMERMKMREHARREGDSQLCATAVMRLEAISAHARSCGNRAAADVLLSARADLLLALWTAHDEASKADATEACAEVLAEMPYEVCP
ncbi:MAG: hypothetical protein U0414_21015 [Polyangiaceae bacterium]